MILCTIWHMHAKKPTHAEALHHRGDEPHLLREIVRTHQVLMAGFSRGVGIPAARFALMRLLVNADRDVGIMDLARQLSINAAAVTRQVQEMESEGLVLRRADPRDKRRHSLRLSPKGLRLFGQIHDRTHALERKLSAVISAEEMASATQTLAKLRAFVESC
jgi:DNA-binding MarR family transcriptional regulator